MRALLIALALLPAFVSAAPGQLDPTFGNGGTVQRNVTVAPAYDSGRVMLRQPDGKIILEGSCETEEGVLGECLVRYAANGALDTTFNGTGKMIAVFDDFASGNVARLSLNSKLYGFGLCSGVGCLIRLNDNGSRDATFGVNGLLPLPGGMIPGSIALQGDKLVVAGNCPANPGVIGCLQRLTTEGAPDTSFGSTGMVNTPLSGSLAVNADKIVIATSCPNRIGPGPYFAQIPDICVTRHNNDGSLDATFNGTGRGIYSITNDDHRLIGVALDGERIVVAAACTPTASFGSPPFVFCAARIATNGALDTTFNGNGKVTVSMAPAYTLSGSLALDGSRVVIAGTCGRMCVVRFNADGSLDTTLNGSGTLVLGSFAPFDASSAQAILVDGSGIFLGGSCRDHGDDDFCLVRLTRSGTLDTAFNGTGRVVTSLGVSPKKDELTALARHADGKIVAVGYCNIGTAEYFNDQFCVAKFNANGSPDTGFNGSGRVFTPLSGISRAAAVVAVGDKTVVAGSCNAGDENQSDFCVVRYLASGELDASFNGTGMTKVDFGRGPDYPTAMVLDGDRILVSGSCNFSGTSEYRFCALRLTSSGQLDITFGVGGKIDVAGWGVSADSGSILAAGGHYYFPSICVAANKVFCLLRLSQNGQLDQGFGVGGRLLTSVAATQYSYVGGAMDGASIYMSGNCQTAASQDACVLRFDLNGVLDPNFAANARVRNGFQFQGFLGITVSQGRVTAFGGCQDAPYCLARFDVDGLLDQGFGTGGVVNAWTTVFNVPQPKAMISAGSSVITGGTCYTSATKNDFCLSRVFNEMTAIAPAQVTARAGDQSIGVTFPQSSNDGGAVITGYVATCTSTDGGVTGSNTGGATAVSIVVSGLTNGKTYSCTVSARNAVGIGAASVASNSVMPTTGTGITLFSVLSRKTHGAAGAFDLLITSPITVESRAIGAGHTLIFQFDAAVTSVSGVTAQDATMNSIGVVSAVPSGNNVVVTLTGVPDNRRVTVAVAQVNGAVSSATATIGFLVGDANNTRSVNSSDISGMKARSGQATDANNFRFDVNASGAINSSDISAVKSRSGLVLP